MTPPVRSFSNMHWEQVPLGRLSRLHTHAMHFKTRDTSGNAPGEEYRSTEESLRAGNHEKVLLGGGLLNVYYLERGRRDGCSAGRAAWWRSKTFWIGGTRPSLFRYEPGTYGCGRRATDTINCDGSCRRSAVPHACYALPRDRPRSGDSCLLALVLAWIIGPTVFSLNLGLGNEGFCRHTETTSKQSFETTIYDRLDSQTPSTDTSSSSIVVSSHYTQRGSLSPCNTGRKRQDLVILPRAGECRAWMLDYWKHRIAARWPRQFGAG